jgi:predicted SPOUT superfamily RNA methylase MTH1
MLTLQIKKIAKKLSVFTVDDISIILDSSEDEIRLAISELVEQNLLKPSGEKFIYVEKIREKFITSAMKIMTLILCKKLLHSFAPMLNQQKPGYL